MDHINNSVKIFDKYASKYQEKYMDVGFYGENLDVFLTELKSLKPSILDVGCGPGNLSQYILSVLPDTCLLGIDLSPNMLRLAQENNPKASFKLMDCRDIANIDIKFDGILCGFCLPYLSWIEVKKIIKEMWQLLSDSGLLYLSFMYSSQHHIQRTENNGDHMYTYYHELTAVLKRLKQCHFNVIHHQCVKSPENASIPTDDVILIAQKV